MHKIMPKKEGEGYTESQIPKSPHNNDHQISKQEYGSAQGVNPLGDGKASRLMPDKDDGVRGVPSSDGSSPFNFNWLYFGLGVAAVIIMAIIFFSFMSLVKEDHFKPEQEIIVNSTTDNQYDFNPTVNNPVDNEYNNEFKNNFTFNFELSDELIEVLCNGSTS